MKTEEIPLPVTMPDGSQEIARLLREPGGHVAILLMPRREGPADPGEWGFIAANMLMHAADMLDDIGIKNETGRVSKGRILARMKEMFDAEWARPTGAVRQRYDFQKGPPS